MVRNYSNFLTSAGIILGAAISLPDTAHAYLDPGTGSVILQVVAAGVLGALFTIKTYWRNFKAFLFGSKPGAQDQSKQQS